MLYTAYNTTNVIRHMLKNHKIKKCYLYNSIRSLRKYKIFKLNDDIKTQRARIRLSEKFNKLCDCTTDILQEKSELRGMERQLVKVQDVE